MRMDKLQLAFFQQVEPYFTSPIENGLKVLLETKHLYQTVRIDYPSRDIFEQAIKYFFRGSEEVLAQSRDGIVKHFRAREVYEI